MNLMPKKTQFKNNIIRECLDLFYERNFIDKLDQNQKINTLAMIAPITSEEKQKILEAITIKDKISALDKIIEFYLHAVNFDNQTIQ